MAPKTDVTQQIEDKATKEKVRERCRSSIFWVGWYLCGYRELSIILHFAIASLFQRRIEDGWRRQLILVPRGHFKTSLLNIAFIIWLVIRDPNIRVLMVMHNLDMAKAKGRKLKAIMRGKAMRTYFPELIPTDKAKMGTTTEWSVVRTAEHAEETVTLAGVATGTTGGHYDVIIIDDGVDIKASGSEQVMANAVNFLEALDPLLESEDSLIAVIGTLWPGGEKGFYERLLNNPRYKKIVLGCYIDERFQATLAEAGVTLPGPEYTAAKVKPANLEAAWQDGQPIFPERRTMEGLADTLAEMGSFKFSHQMLNVLVDEGQRRFRREDFRKYNLQYSERGAPTAVWIDEVAYPWSRGIVTVAMDPTGGMNKESDYCGITACWWYSPGRFGCLLDFFHENNVDPKQQIETFLDMAIKWNVDVMIPESGSMQVWVGAWLRDAMVRRQQFFRVHEYRTGGVKKGRRILDAFHPYVAGHQFYVLYPEHAKVVDHLVNLAIAPDGTILGESPALADTFPMHREFWKPGTETRLSGMDMVRDEDEFENARRRRRDQHVRYGLCRGVRGGV
jgi:hypothetical protein